MKFKLLISTTLIMTLAACGGADERKAVYMEKAKSSIEAGDLEKARIELKNVLQIDPKDGEAYYQLGSVFEQQKDYRKAYGNYLKAEELSPELLLNQAKLGRFYLILMNDSAKAQEKIDLILLKEPDNADGLLLKASLMLRNKNKEEAIAIAKNIVAKNPEHIESIAFLASVYMQDKKLTDAIHLLDKALKNNIDNEKLNRLLAIALLNNKEYERAEVIYKNFLERHPDNSASYNNLAAFYNQTDNKAKAEEILRASVENDKNDVDRQLTLIKYIKAIKSNDAAIDELKNLIARHNGLGDLRLALTELYIIEGDKKSAIEVCNQAIKDFPEEVTGVKARIALASIYISEGEYDKASEVVEAAILISPNNPEVNFMRAKLALRDKDIEKAIISLRIVTKEQPENIDAYILLAKAYQFEKNDEQVKNILNTAYANNKTNADGLLKLAQYQLSRDINEASKIIDDYNNLKDKDYDGLSIKAAILNQSKELSEAYKIAKTLMESYPDKPNGYLQAVPYLGKQEDKREAVSVLEKGYLSTKDNRKLLVLLTSIQVGDKKFDIAEKRIKAELKASPDDVELKILLAKVYMVSDKADLAEPLLNEIVEINPNLENAYLLLSQLYQSNEDPGSVKTILIKGKAAIPLSIKIPLKLASIYEVEGLYEEAINVYTELNKSQPDNLLVINNLVSLLTDYGNGKNDLESAKALVQKLEESNQPVFLDTIGWLYYKLGDVQKSVQYLTQAVEQMPGINVFNYHLGMAYKQSGDKELAKRYLEKSLADKKSFKEKSMAEAALKSL